MIPTSKIEAILGRSRNGRWVRHPDTYLGKLQMARALLTRENWIQGAYAVDRQGRELKTARTKQAVKFCMLGATENVSADYQQYWLLKSLLAAAADVPVGDLSKLNDSKPAPKVEEKDTGKEHPDLAYALVLAIYDVAIKSLQLLVTE